MGTASCCFHVSEPEEDVNTSDNGSCTCLSGLIHTVFNKYSSFFRRDQAPNLRSIDQRPVSFTSNVPSDNPGSETITSVPRTLPFDANSTHSNLQQGGLGATNGHGADLLHLHKYSQVRISDHVIQEHVNEGNKVTEGETKECCPGSSLKSPLNKVEPEYVHESSEEEDVCPTCLEEYTPENPKIVTKCCHHYHLSCIYEWMERSVTCPVCSKVMKFDETT